MIVEVNDIRDYRPLSTNIENRRIETYINEVERLEIIPAIGVAEYRRLEAGTDLTDDEQLLLEGGDYTNYAGVDISMPGLRTAICYLAYARFVRAQSVSVTPFGVVVKSTDESQPAGQQAVSAIALEAEKVGREYLSQTMAYWHSITGLRGKTGKKKRFIGIG